MTAGAFKRSSRGRCAVPSWTRGYHGRFVTRRPWGEIATLGRVVSCAWGLGSAAALLWLVAAIESGTLR